MFFHVCQPKYRAIIQQVGPCTCAASVFQRCHEEDGWIVCPECGPLEPVAPVEEAHDRI